MVARLIKSSIRRCFRALGLEVRRVSPGGLSLTDRDSLVEMLGQIKRLGVAPRTVVDVGAAGGSFTRECAALFPEAHYLLIEPLIEYEKALSELARSLSKAQYVCAAAAARSGEMAINVHPDLLGSSLLREVEIGTGVNGVPRGVRSVAIDHLIGEARAAGPFLLKVDVQGAELDVLRGAEALLREAEYVLLEVSFFQFFEHGPQFVDVVDFMRTQGFTIYDISALQYRPLDHALSQADVAFVKETGRFRRHHFYATPLQRAKQNERMQAYLSHLLGQDR